MTDMEKHFQGLINKHLAGYFNELFPNALTTQGTLESAITIQYPTFVSLQVGIHNAVMEFLGEDGLDEDDVREVESMIGDDEKAALAAQVTQCSNAIKGLRELANVGGQRKTMVKTIGMPNDAFSAIDAAISERAGGDMELKNLVWGHCLAYAEYFEGWKNPKEIVEQLLGPKAIWRTWASRQGQRLNAKAGFVEFVPEESNRHEPFTGIDKQWLQRPRVAWLMRQMCVLGHASLADTENGVERAKLGGPDNGLDGVNDYEVFTWGFLMAFWPLMEDGHNRAFLRAAQASEIYNQRHVDKIQAALAERKIEPTEENVNRDLVRRILVNSMDS